MAIKKKKTHGRISLEILLLHLMIHNTTLNPTYSLSSSPEIRKRAKVAKADPNRGHCVIKQHVDFYQFFFSNYMLLVKSNNLVHN